MERRIRWWQRRYFVHPIQRKYFFLSLVPLVVCAFLLILLVFLPPNLALMGADEGPAEMVAVRQSYYPLAIRIWPAVLLSMVGCGFLSFFATHAFAGPLYRIQQILREIAEGQLPMSIRIRSNDDLQELATLLDRAVGRLASALTAIRERQELAGRDIATLHGNVRAGLIDATKILKGLEQIGRHQSEVENLLAGFSLRRSEERQGIRDSEPVSSQRTH